MGEVSWGTDASPWPSKKGTKMSRYEQFGKRLRSSGYDVIPLKGKIPMVEGWQSRPEPDFDSFPKANIGVVLGGQHNVIAVDIDVLDPVAAQKIKALAEDMLGAAPERIGRAPKTMLIYRASVPTRKIKTAIYGIAGIDAAVEVLAEGQQFAASGIHPDTKKPYAWPRDSLLDYPAAELTLVTPDGISEFVAAANVVLSDHGAVKAKSLTNGARQLDDGFQFAENEQATTAEKLRAALDMLPNPDLHYDDWVHIAHAIKGAVGDAGIELFKEWSGKSGKSDPEETQRLWKSISQVTKIGAGTVFHLAAKSGFDVANWDKQFSPSDLTGMDADEFADASEAPVSPAKAVVAKRWTFTADTVHGPLPDREWVLEGWFPHKTVAMLFGDGGVGKTLLMQQLGNCVAEGEPFFGIATKKMPVLMVMCEDDELEVKRRQLDINKWRGIDEFGAGPADFHLGPRVGGDNILVTFPNQGEDKAGVFFGHLCEEIEFAKGDAENILVILDTAADMFGGNENVRREVNTLLKTYLGSIAVKYDATVILLAHPSLSGMASKSGLSGSTGWQNGVRARSYLSRVEDSDDIRILSRKKSNYSDISGDSDITLIWENGVLIVPTSPNQLDRIHDTALKHDVMAEVDMAWGDKNGIRKQGLRGYKTALPKRLPQHKTGAVVKAFNSLVAEGNIIHIERFGFKTEKSI